MTPTRTTIEAQSPLSPHIPADPFVAMMWMSCLRWTLTQQSALDAFREATGNAWTPAKTPIDRMIDDATGAAAAWLAEYAAWFNENVWGNEDEEGKGL